MKNPIKPIYIINEHGLASLEKEAFFSGLKKSLQIAGVYDIFMKHDLIKDFGIKEGYSYQNGVIITHPSVDLYLQDDCWDEKHKRLDIFNLISLLDKKTCKKDGREGYNYYDVMIIHSDIYDSRNTDAANKKLNGAGSRGLGAIISTYKLKDLNDKLRFGCIETLTMHELGHMFGIISKKRTENVYEEGGLHCNNMCVMKQGRRVPGGYPAITEHRLKHGPFCGTCEKDLKAIFRNKRIR
jgi:predicted Zn-dependent protease